MAELSSLERERADLSLQCRALLREVEELRASMASPAVQRARIRSAQQDGSANVNASAEQTMVDIPSDAKDAQQVGACVICVLRFFVCACMCVFMYVCMYVYIYIYIYIYVYMYICIYV
jgi:hypothetical protein